MSIHNECKLSLLQGMNKYNDIYFQALIKIFKSIRILKELSTDTIKTLIFKMKQRKVSVGTPLLQFKEYSSTAFFLFSGIVSVYIVDQSEGEMYHFQDLKEGSSFNLLNCMLDHYSLFFLNQKQTES